MSNVGESHAELLLHNNPLAYTEFYPSRAPCIYKTGPAWFAHTGPEAYPIDREARPVYRPDIAPVWASTLQRIGEHLDVAKVDFNTVSPVGYADKGEPKPFCAFLLYVGVTPCSLSFEDAVAAAPGVKDILATIGLSEVAVAFVETTITFSSNLFVPLVTDNLPDSLPEFCKPFSSALALPITRFDNPDYEGAGGLYFRLDGVDGQRVAMLTCAHVLRPPPLFRDNKGMSYDGDENLKELVVALGPEGFRKITADMRTQIDKRLPTSIAHNRGQASRLSEGGTSRIDMMRQYHEGVAAAAEMKLNALRTLRDEVVESYSALESRVIGWLLHTAPIQTSVPPLGYTEDWGFFELDVEKINWETFVGNKVFVGGKLSPEDFGHLMYPGDQKATQQEELNFMSGLMQADGVVQDAEIRSPGHRDVHGDPCLFVFMHGPVSGTSVGRVNGLESLTRRPRNYGIPGLSATSFELIVFPYDSEHAPFSRRGDSGSVVLTRDRKILGIVTGGIGPTDAMDMTYIVPYWWLERRFQPLFPDAVLYPAVA